MAKLTEEQRQARAAKRAMREALAAEARDRRLRERDERWKREGVQLTWQEFEDGLPCRGCGDPMYDGLGDWWPLLKLSEAERAEYETAQERFSKKHSDCKDMRWSVSGSRVMHCSFCCPPPPLSPKQIERLAEFFTNRPSSNRKDLDAWGLTLTCGHVVEYIQHRDHSYVSTSVVDCPECHDRRGVVRSDRRGPARQPEQLGRERSATERARLAERLRATEAQLARQQRGTDATRVRVEELRRQLGDDS
jgi:hypothetical protein